MFRRRSSYFKIFGDLDCLVKMGPILALFIFLLIPLEIAAQDCRLQDEQVSVLENNPINYTLTNVTTSPGFEVVVPPDFSDLLEVVDSKLILKPSVDYEMNLTFIILLQCVNNGGIVRVMTFVIIVVNVNDNPPVFSHSSYNFTVPEDLKVNASIGPRIEATDLDNEPLSYELKEMDMTDAVYFRLTSVSNALILVNQPLDYDNFQKTQLYLIVRDSAIYGGTFTSTATINIEIQDVDNVPPRFIPCTDIGNKICISSGYTCNVTRSELVTGPLILSPGPIYAVDGDVTFDPVILYSIISGNNENIFSMDQLTGNITMLKTADQLRPIIMQVMGQQANDPLQYAMTTVQIEVLDKNGHPPTFENSSYLGQITSGSEIGSFILDSSSPNKPLQVFAMDEDFPDKVNPNIIYIIQGNNNFTITRDGFIRTNAEFQSPSSTNFMVTATDSVTNELATTSVTVEITPGITTPAPTTTTPMISTTTGTRSTTSSIIGTGTTTSATPGTGTTIKTTSGTGTTTSTTPGTGTTIRTTSGTGTTTSTTPGTGTTTRTTPGTGTTISTTPGTGTTIKNTPGTGTTGSTTPGTGTTIRTTSGTGTTTSTTPRTGTTIKTTSGTGTTTSTTRGTGTTIKPTTGTGTTRNITPGIGTTASTTRGTGTTTSTTSGTGTTTHTTPTTRGTGSTTSTTPRTGTTISITPGTGTSTSTTPGTGTTTSTTPRTGTTTNKVPVTGAASSTTSGTGTTTSTTRGTGTTTTIALGTGTTRSTTPGTGSTISTTPGTGTTKSVITGTDTATSVSTGTGDGSNIIFKGYSSSDMAAVGASLGAILALCLVGLGFLLYKQYGDKIRARLGKQQGNDYDSFDGGTRPITDEESGDISGQDLVIENSTDFDDNISPFNVNFSIDNDVLAEPLTETNLFAAAAVATTFLPSENPTDIQGPERLTDDSDSEDTKGVKSILTKEHKADPSYKAVWFMEGAEPEVVVIEGVEEGEADEYDAAEEFSNNQQEEDEDDETIPTFQNIPDNMNDFTVL
ncbi:cadherin-related family member 5 isoform X1 [Pelobates cultripes]|uniref:Cadherin-related family member 5 isoform X1 n=1 Tax=Pelobates cultripes TaxID=61616 RepID=A0AAD1WWN3_PELCU|nr:cadherin-related family member 5 isoform X1 [Pelobates cultripes]